MEIAKLFRPVDDVFTVYVVEQRFAVGRGYDYLHSYLNTANYVTTDEQIKSRFARIINNIGKNVAPVSSLLSLFSTEIPIASISEVITALCKLFTVHEHQAAGPDVIDPIILQEGKITRRMLTNLININKDSIIAPSIIIILKDNNFERAKQLLSECPDGINIKMIRNSGEETVYKVVNCGANNITEFIESFSEQCFSTCSKTKRDLLLNTEWANDPIVSKYSPSLFKIRASLLFDQKNEIRSELTQTILDIGSETPSSSRDTDIINCILCVARLFSAFCNDAGGKDIIESHRLAQELNNNILLGHVYRYAEFLPGCSESEKVDLYDKGYQIFRDNQMVDHAIYCKNNKLIHQFYSSSVFPEMFREMQEEAVNSVPGMVGLSHIYNNVGVAYLYCGDSSTAINFFKHGLDYAKYQDRIVQRLALKSNEMIARSYSFDIISEQELYLLLRQIFDGMGLNRLPFLSADYVLNVLSVAYHQNVKLGAELIHHFPVKELIDRSFATNTMGSGERLLQMQYLAAYYGDTFPLLNVCNIPPQIYLTTPCGKKEEFILRYGFSPFEFNTWL